MRTRSCPGCARADGASLSATSGGRSEAPGDDGWRLGACRRLLTGPHAGATCPPGSSWAKSDIAWPRGEATVSPAVTELATCAAAVADRFTPRGRAVSATRGKKSTLERRGCATCGAGRLDRGAGETMMISKFVSCAIWQHSTRKAAGTQEPVAGKGFRRASLISVGWRRRAHTRHFLWRSHISASYPAWSFTGETSRGQ